MLFFPTFSLWGWEWNPPAGEGKTETVGDIHVSSTANPAQSQLLTPLAQSHLAFGPRAEEAPWVGRAPENHKESQAGKGGG